MQGLTSQEVNRRKQEGKVNSDQPSKLKTNKEIVISNIINYFNILNLVFGILVLLSGEIKNVLFLIVVIINTVIATYQELKSKAMIEQLSLISKNKVTVIRDGERILVDPSEIVVDDLYIVKTGDQNVVDSILLEGDIEVDESNLTGESDLIHKSKESFVYSGSNVVSGVGYLKVKYVGKENYINRLLEETKVSKKYPSQLRSTLDTILKMVTVAIIPIGILTFVKNIFFAQFTFSELILRSVAPLIGMIPSGLILLTSVALAVSVYRLAQKKILIQELYCIETLARVDVLCVDKTGTITKGIMEVVDSYGDIHSIMPKYLGSFEYENASEKALIAYFGKEKSNDIASKVEFSSQRKYSSVTFKKDGTYVLGAYEFIIKQKNSEDEAKIKQYVEQGYRVLTLAHSELGVKENYLPYDLKMIGFIVINDVLRENTQKMFNFFERENVEIKVISGDNPTTVAAIAKKAGLSNVRAIDVSTLSDEEIQTVVLKHNVFGRVNPQQKKLMVQTLQEHNHRVAMTGDGVNDVAALEKADIGIAMAEGSDAAKQIANVVLLENDFENLYSILMEGRRVINNIERVSTLFLSKTFFAIIFALIAIFSTLAFPFIPIQLTLVSNLTIGVPAFLLTFKDSKQRIKDHFMQEVLKKSTISSLLLSLSILFTIIVSSIFNPLSAKEISTIATYLGLFLGLMLIIAITRPLDYYTKLIVIIMSFVALVATVLFASFFELQILTMQTLIVTVVIAFISSIILFLSIK